MEESFGVKVKRQRLNQRMSLQDLALLSGISLIRIHHIETQGNVTDKEKEKLRKVLDAHELQ